MSYSKTKKVLALLLTICMVLASSSYAKAYEDDYPDMSNAELAKTSITMYRVGYHNAHDSVAILNAPDLSYDFFDYRCSNRNLNVNCYLDIGTKSIEIYASGTGSGVLTFTLNNKLLYLSISVVPVNINKQSLLIVKKKKAKLKLKNYSAKANWMVTKKNIVSISSSGEVKAKKIGNTVAYAKVGNDYIGCAISVVSKKMKTVVNAAYKISKGKYSQPKRMKKGYYDCSSLVWRAYKKAKITLANKYYAPVAADLAKYYVKKKKKIKGGKSSKNISKMKLLPGDLYFCTGTKNGRYKGINHVEMFTGYVCVDIGSPGDITILPKWGTVADGYYYDKSIMVRPYKQK
ncbi:MAG: C40 family peptidase [Eubacterium sp.]|nr:C40 family peptidase [Eubacterium sp.]